jgi:putative restriction endonuclease
VKLYVGVTDDQWFEFLAERRPDEVNFWRPGGTQDFRVLSPGAPFLFKLHSPRNFVVGGGFFVRHTVLPLSLAWECFGEKNGAATLEEVARLIQRRRGDTDPNPQIGCTILTEPFFLERQDWIPVPADWSANIVSGKSYEMDSGLGLALWVQVQERLAAAAGERAQPPAGAIAEPAAPRYGNAYLSRARLGQGAFRVLVTDSYHRRCAMTGERTLPVLQAAHIKPFAESGPNRVSNGLLLRSDLHILFDKGYLTVSPDLRVEVSKRIKEEFENGRDYYALAGRPLANLPETADNRPSQEFLEWHREKKFVS